MYGYCLAVTTKYDSAVPSVIYFITLIILYVLYFGKGYHKFIRIQKNDKFTKILRLIYPFYPALLTSFGVFYDWTMTNCELNSASGTPLRLFWTSNPFFRVLYSIIFLMVYVSEYKSYVHTDDDFVFYAFFIFMGSYFLIYSLRIIDIFRLR